MLELQIVLSALKLRFEIQEYPTTKIGELKQRVSRLAEPHWANRSVDGRFELCLIRSNLEQNQDVWLIGDDTTLEFQQIKTGDVLDYANFNSAELVEAVAAAEPRSSTSGAAPVQLEGYMLKRGSKGVVLSWKRRFFRIEDNRLLYFEKEPIDPLLPLGYISLGTGASIQESFAIPDVDSSLLIEISTQNPMRVWYLQAESAPQRAIWLRGLHDAIAYWQTTEKSWLEGYLTKRGGLRKNWLIRWCILRSDFLYYYETKDNSYYLKGKIPLYTATVLAAEESKNKVFRGRNFGFSIMTTDREYQMCANNQEDRDRWISRLRTNVYALEESLSSIRIDV